MMIKRTRMVIGDGESIGSAHGVTRAYFHGTSGDPFQELEWVELDPVGFEGTGQCIVRFKDRDYSNVRDDDGERVSRDSIYLTRTWF